MSLFKKLKKPSQQENQKWISSNSEARLSIDLYETEQDIVIQSTIAGVKAKDLDISVEDEMLTIKGKRQKQEHEDPSEKKYLYQECYWGAFTRKIMLPEEVDASKIKAVIEEGVLTLRIPKIKKEEKKKIKILEK